MDAPRMWIGCVGCYNEGILAGDWFDPDDAPQSMTGDPDDTEHFNAVIDERKVTVSPHHYRDGHEELWVFDHEGFDGFVEGEMSPVTGARIGAAIEAIIADGQNPAVVGYWFKHYAQIKVGEFEWDAPTADRFQSSYRGEMSAKEYVQSFYEDDSDTLQNVPDDVRAAIDWEQVAEGWSLDEVRIDGATHLFDTEVD